MGILRRLWIGAGLFALLVGGAAVVARAGAADPWCAAMERYQEAQYTEARAALRLLDTGVPDVELDFHLGRLALWFDDEAEALLRLERALAASPHEARLHNAWGDACGLAAQRAALWQKPGWARRCLAAYRRAVELEPENPQWRWSLVGYFCVAPGLVGGGIARARAEAGELARLDPLQGALAEVTVLLADHRPAAAFARLDTLRRAHPADGLVWYHVGRCAALSGEEVRRGIDALRRCLELPLRVGDGRPSLAAVHFRLGELLARAGDAEGARREREIALALQPDFRMEKMALRW